MFVTNSLGVGGIETNIVRLTRELVRRGHDVQVAARPGELSGSVAEAGGRLLPLRMAPRSPPAVAADVRLLAAAVTADRADVLHVFSAAAAVATGAARALCILQRTPPAPVVASVMGLHGAPDEADAAVRLRVLLTSLGARRLVVMAPAIDAVVRSLPVSRKRVVHQSVVGVELPDRDAGPEDRKRVRAELGLAEQHKVITTIGRLEPRKSHELFVRAAARVHAQRAESRFLVVGDGAEETRLRREIAVLGLGDVVRLLGHRNDVDALLRASDVCVRPGVVEGFIGITVLEAQSLGVPVISFDTEDVRLAVLHEKTGLLVPRGDVPALAESVLRLLGDPALAHRLAEAGRQHVERTYALAAVTTGLEELYADVSASRGRN